MVSLWSKVKCLAADMQSGVTQVILEWHECVIQKFVKLGIEFCRSFSEVNRRFKFLESEIKRLSVEVSVFNEKEGKEKQVLKDVQQNPLLNIVGWRRVPERTMT